MRKRILALAIPLTVVALLMIQPGWLGRSVSPRVTYSVQTQEPLVALTIDDGPDPETTPVLLDVLGELGAKATFFLITERIPGNESLVQRMVREGHELGNHMTSEEASILLGNDGFERELGAADSALTAFGEVRWLRPGSGWFNDEMLDTAEENGYQMALASVYPLDTLIRSSWFASEFILWRVQPGDVILLHDHRWRGEQTAETLRRVIPELNGRGYEIVSLSELVEAAG